MFAYDIILSILTGEYQAGEPLGDPAGGGKREPAQPLSPIADPSDYL